MTQTDLACWSSKRRQRSNGHVCWMALSIVVSQKFILRLPKNSSCLFLSRACGCYFHFSASPFEMFHRLLSICFLRYLIYVNVTRGSRKSSATAWLPVQGSVSVSYRVVSASANAIGSSKGRLNPSQQISIGVIVNVADQSAGVLSALTYTWHGETVIFLFCSLPFQAEFSVGQMAI